VDLSRHAPSQAPAFSWRLEVAANKNVFKKNKNVFILDDMHAKRAQSPLAAPAIQALTRGAVNFND
jgi:hypothetical protein